MARCCGGSVERIRSLLACCNALKRAVARHIELSAFCFTHACPTGRPFRRRTTPAAVAENVGDRATALEKSGSLISSGSLNSCWSSHCREASNNACASAIVHRFARAGVITSAVVRKMVLNCKNVLDRWRNGVMVSNVAESLELKYLIEATPTQYCPTVSSFKSP